MWYGAAGAECPQCALQPVVPGSVVLDVRMPARITELEQALRDLIARVRRVGGYSTPEEQDALWRAEQLLSTGGRP